MPIVRVAVVVVRSVSILVLTIAVIAITISVLVATIAVAAVPVFIDAVDIDSYIVAVTIDMSLQIVDGTVGALDAPPVVPIFLSAALIVQIVDPALVVLNVCHIVADMGVLRLRRNEADQSAQYSSEAEGHRHTSNIFHGRSVLYHHIYAHFAS